MNPELMAGVLWILALSGVLMGVMQYLAVVKYPDRRLRPPKPNRIELKTKIINVAGNSLITVSMILAYLSWGGESLIYNHEASGMTIFGEALAVLLVYDFMYYFLHRGMHHKSVMQKVHGVHHYIRHPTAFESVYVHPLEGIAGISLLLISLTVLGPISVDSFLVAFVIYTSVNILVHANIEMKNPIFKLTNYWARRHDIHHGTQLNKNYASIFPFWDLMFDTYA